MCSNIVHMYLSAACLAADVSGNSSTLQNTNVASANAELSDSARSVIIT